MRAKVKASTGRHGALFVMASAWRSIALAIVLVQMERLAQAMTVPRPVRRHFSAYGVEPDGMLCSQWPLSRPRRQPTVTRNLAGKNALVSF